MTFDMPYMAACLNRELQSQLAFTLAEWAESLNKRLENLGKSLLTIDLAKSRKIEGFVVVDELLLRAFTSEQLTECNGLIDPLVLNGIRIGIPLCYEETATLCLTFIQADKALCDGLAVNLWRPISKQLSPASPKSVVVGSVTSQLSDLDVSEEIINRAKNPVPDWIISRPCFFPRLHREWLSRLITTLQGFDNGLFLKEIGNEFIPPPQFAVDSVPGFAARMEALADQYIKECAASGNGQEGSQE